MNSEIEVKEENEIIANEVVLEVKEEEEEQQNQVGAAADNI